VNLASYIPLAGSVCNVFFALFVFAQSPRAKANRVYLTLGLAIATWNLGQYFLFVVPASDAYLALFWARFCFVGVIFTISGFFHLSMVVAGFELRRWLYALYGFQFFLLALNCTSYFIRGVHYLGTSGWYSIAGPAFYFLTVPYGLSFISLGVLWQKRKSLPNLQRHRMTSLIGAQVILFVLGINDLMPIIGLTHYPFTNAPVYPYGSITAVFYGIIVAYSVLHHQLLDVHVALSQAAAHAVRFAFLFFMSAGLLLVAALITDAFNSLSFIIALAVFMTGAVASSLLFPKLFGGMGMEKLERRILGDRFEYHDQIRSFIASMQMYTDTMLLLNDLHGLLTKTICVQSYKIFLLDEMSRKFLLFRSHPDEEQQNPMDLAMESPVFRYFESTKKEYLMLNTSYTMSDSNTQEENVRAQLKPFKSEFCFPFVFEEELFGLLLVGAKSGNLPYTSTDLNLFTSLVKNLSVIINQIRLKNQIQQAQEIELLGRMSRGMAHDLNNLLTPIWTFLQLSSEGATPQDLNEDLLPVSLRNIKTMRAYIREALFFSQNMRPDFQMGRLDVVTAQGVDLVRSKTEKRVDILVSNSGEILVEMDEVLIQRLLANIISNAVDASRPGSSIHIEIQRFSKTGQGSEWLRVSVADFGEGIRPEDLSKVFTPYFTTKDRGDEERGFGLGLAICRRIVHLHNGNLNITSQLGKGTTVQIDLPSRQIKTPTPITTNEQK
jgi:signal transduction histidine kinase